MATKDPKKLSKDKAFLAVFFGISPFCIFGIHDFIMGKKKLGILRLIGFTLIFILFIIGPIANAAVSMHTIPQDFFGDPDVIQPIMEQIPLYLTGVAYATSILEVIIFLSYQTN